MITRDEMQDWLRVFKKAWINKDFGTLREIFSEIKEYYESPFHKAATNVDEVMKLWEEIENQEIKDLDLFLLTVDGNNAIVNWILDCNEGAYNGIYLIRFNDHDMCNYFVQWTVKK